MESFIFQVQRLKQWILNYQFEAYMLALLDINILNILEESEAYHIISHSGPPWENR